MPPVATRMGNRPWTDAELSLLRDTSLKLTEVAELTGRSLGSVYGAASKYGSGERVQGRPRKMDEDGRRPQRNIGPQAIRLLAETRLSYTAIADVTGLDRESIRKAAYYLGLANRGQLKGSKAHRWRGGKKQRLQAAGGAWDEIRLSVLERDGFMCKDCDYQDLSGTSLHVHH